MQENELYFYEKIGNWNFQDLNVEVEITTNWDFNEKIKENSNQNSICLDLGTGGGENVLKKYPNVRLVIGTDFSLEMIKTANENAKKYQRKDVKFVYMNSLEITFPNNLFDIVSARHTVIDANKIYDVLVPNGTLIIEGIAKNDCIDLKKIFGRGQGYNDDMCISKKDYNEIVEAGFSKIEKVEIFQNEYYKTKDDLMDLLIKTPILDNFSEIEYLDYEQKSIIEKNFLDEYVEKYKTPKGILLKRVLYGIVAKK